MLRPITIQDNGGDRYTITTTISTLGRRYDNNAENIVVNFPEAEIEAGHICTMIVTAFGKVVDHIDVENGVEVPVTNNLSQYSEVKIGFSFTDDEGYVKNSETKTFKFLEAQKPDGFVPVPPEQSGNIDALIRKGFVDVEYIDNNIIFYNLAHQEVARIEVQGGSGDSGCKIYVNGEEVSELSFDSDPQTQIDTINTAISLVEEELRSKASVEYVDERFNGANKALAFDSYAIMVTALNALDDETLNLGQNVYIVTRNVPDLWISSVEETSVPYVYVDDTTLINTLSTTGYVQVGYYKLSALETEKVDLTNYVTLNTDQTITGAKTFTVEQGKVRFSGPSSYVYNLYGSRLDYLAVGYGQKSSSTSNDLYCFRYDSFAPSGNNVRDLGRNISMWKNLYIYGKLSNSTDEISVAEIVQGLASGAKIHEYEESTTLTQAILDDVKSGDIIKVNNMEFIVNNKANQTPRSITGTMLIGNNQYIKLDWEIGQTLTPTIQQVVPTWYGTQAQYDALETYDSNTTYNILES